MNTFPAPKQPLHTLSGLRRSSLTPEAYFPVPPQASHLTNRVSVFFFCGLYEVRYTFPLPLQALQGGGWLRCLDSTDTSYRLLSVCLPAATEKPALS